MILGYVECTISVRVYLYPVDIVESTVPFSSIVQIGDRPAQGDDLAGNTKLLAQCLGNVTIIRKGLEDIISDGITGVNSSALNTQYMCAHAHILCAVLQVLQ